MTMDKFNMFGISGNTHCKLEDVFDVWCDDSEHYFAMSKDTFEHNDDNLTFKYKYCIEADVCECDTFYSLSLVPTPDSLCEKKFNSVLQTSGCQPEELNTYDVALYGISVDMGSTKTQGEEIREDTLEAIANTMTTIDGLKGFFIDKPVNAVGWNGWTILRNAINGEVLK